MIGKIIVILAMLTMFAGGFAQTKVFAIDAYSKGYADAVCDSNNCHGHGYDPSCPSEHSDNYCNNYANGYSAGWNNGNFRTVDNHNQDQSGAIGGNKINGDNNIVNQQILQQQTPQVITHTHTVTTHHHSDNNDNNDGNGQLPRCKLFCLGVQ